MSTQKFVILVVLGAQLASGKRIANANADAASKLTRASGLGLAATASVSGAQTQSDSEGAFESELGAMITSMITSNKPTVREVQQTGFIRMNVNDAISRVQNILPTEIASMVRIASKSKFQGSAEAEGFSEVSLQKARRILNSMIEASQRDLDTAVIECKEFCLRNRKTYAQVQSDISRLGSQVADLERKRSECNDGIAMKDQERADVLTQIDVSTRNFHAALYANTAEMTIRQNDLAVFNFILQMVRCKGSSSSLMQLELNENGHAPVQICGLSDGGLELKFDDPVVQAKVERMMTPEARLALREALGQQLNSVGLVQVEGHQDPPPTVNTTTAPTLAVAMPTVPPAEGPAPTGQWKKCTGSKPNCALLHDSMSLQWGKFKDLVDELQEEMGKNQDAFDALSTNLNAQLQTIANDKAIFSQMLAETISGLNADVEEGNEKNEQERDLRREFEHKMREYKARISEIMFTNICAVKQVRNAVMRYSSTSHPSQILDCDVGDWMTGPCSVECDDACPNPDPFACGGWQTLTREPVVLPNNFGVICPALTNKKKCNQMKCPVDCVVSQWSGWGSCTRECEGGVQGRTRNILTRAKNGGQFCPPSSETRQCNTMSCDRDCSLVPWTDWSPCSMACGGGLQTRHRTVLVPIRGQGKCPTTSSNNRFTDKTCNAQACVGDEICIASTDIVIALDASGSLKESGFNTMRDFAGNITNPFTSLFWGNYNMKVGLVVFGNGQVLADGTIAPALVGQELTFDMAELRTSIAGTSWQRGFTNMAQAFAVANTQLGQGGRSKSHSAVLVLSDGKASFQHQTRNQAQALKEQGISIYMVAVTDFHGPELEFMKTVASVPWESNYLHIPGLADLVSNAGSFAQTVIAKFCPDAVSISHLNAIDNEREYMMIHENGEPSEECAGWYYLGEVASIDVCAAAARARNNGAFKFGKGTYAALHCYPLMMDTTEALWSTWQANRSSPACPSTHPRARWVTNPYYDTYAIKPISPAR